MFANAKYATDKQRKSIAFAFFWDVRPFWLVSFAKLKPENPCSHKLEPWKNLLFSIVGCNPPGFPHDIWVWLSVSKFWHRANIPSNLRNFENNFTFFVSKVLTIPRWNLKDINFLELKLNTPFFKLTFVFSSIQCK